MGRVLEIGSRLTEKDDLILVSLALKYQALYGVDSMKVFFGRECVSSSRRSSIVHTPVSNVAQRIFLKSGRKSSKRKLKRVMAMRHEMMYRLGP